MRVSQKLGFGSVPDYLKIDDGSDWFIKDVVRVYQPLVELSR